MTTQVTEVKGAPISTNAATIEKQSAIVVEAEGNKGILMQRLVEAAKKYAAAEDSLTKSLGADLVLSIVPLMKLPVKIRPKYAAIAEQITLGMGRGDIVARTQVRLPDESLKDRGAKAPAYKQQATRWVNMARWEAQLYNKAETKHQERNPGWKVEVKHNGTTYDSPVTMLRAGVAYSTVHQAFRNIMQPAFVDFSTMSERATEKAAQDAAGKLSVSIRTVNDDGDVVKGKQPIVGSAPLTFGAIKGLLSGLKAPLSQKRYDELIEALLLVKPAPVTK